MKKLIVILVIICTVFGVPEELEDAKKKAEEYVKFCIDDTGISEEDANKIKAGDFSARDEKAQCFTHCFFKKAGFVNEQGEPQLEAMVNKLSNKPGDGNDALKELLEKCIKEKGENDCETSFKIYECYRGGASYNPSLLKKDAE